MTEKNALNDATPYIPDFWLGKPEPGLSILRYSEYEMAVIPILERHNLSPSAVSCTFCGEPFYAQDL
jgi:hypothetical protein